MAGKCIRRATCRAGVAVAVAMLAVGCHSDGEPEADPPSTDGATAPAGVVTQPEGQEQPPPTLGTPSGEVTLLFGGDVHYEGPLAARLSSNPSSLLAGIQSAIDQADITTFNLETAIGTGGDPQSKAFTFRAPPRAFDALKESGVDVIGMANNHTLDYGQSGFSQTLAAIGEHQAPVIGVGANVDAAFAPLYKTANERTIAFINATQVIDASLVKSWTATEDNPGVASAKDIDRLTATVAAAKERAHTVVVFLHWGTEKMTCPNQAQSSLAQRLEDAGADVIVGGHAHRVQGGGFLGSAYVEYGLGNLQFSGGSSLESRTAGLLKLTIAADGSMTPRWLPVLLGSDGRPQLRTGAEAEAAIRAWDKLRACAKLADQPSAAATP